MDIPSLHSLGSSYYPSFTSKPDNPDKDFKKSDNLPFPPRLRERLPCPKTPWKINDALFKRLQFSPPPTTETEKYHKVELTSSDPESEFVRLLFNHDRPRNRSIRKIHCMHNPELTRGFETNLPLLEAQASNPVFAPQLDEETDVPLRKHTLQRWQSAAHIFSPFKLKVTSRKTQKFTKTYILPLWHGTSEPICKSIASTGFTYFGKHSFKQDKDGDGRSTDIGYFGSGIYFTNSARYCSKTYGPEHMMLAWVAMRQPFPVVADHPCISSDDEPRDKAILKRLGAYDNYNAHYIPVLKVRTSGKPTVYYPCAEGQKPQYDEIVVFEKQQALPRFWIELEVDLPISPSPYPSSFSSSSSSTSLPSSFSLSSLSSSSTSSISSPSSHPQILGTLLDKLYETLEAPAVQRDKEIRLFLEDHSRTLLLEDPSALLSSKYFALANSIGRLLDQTGKVRRVVAQSLLPSSVRLSNPEKGIRFLLSIPSPPSSVHAQQGRPVVTDKVVRYLDGRSATHLLTSCRRLKEFSLTHALYASLLRRDFPALYRPLEPMVSMQQGVKRGLRWQRLYAMSHGPDPKPQLLCGHTDTVTCLTQLADGRLASGSDDNTVRIWPLDGSAPTVLMGHTGRISCLAQLADGRIASGSHDDTVRIWPLDGSAPTSLKGHTGHVYCLMQLADRRITSGSFDHTVRIWPSDRSAPTILKGHRGALFCLTQLADGRIASGSSDCTVRIWPLDGSTPTVLKGHAGGVNCLMQLADGRIASGSGDGTVRIWPLDGSAPTLLKGHTGEVDYLTQLADGFINWRSGVDHLAQLADGRLASGSGSDNGTVRIWPLDGSTPTVFKGHAGSVTCLAQLADGRLASGSDDRTVRIWEAKNPWILFRRAVILELTPRTRG